MIFVGGQFMILLILTVAIMFVVFYIELSLDDYDEKKMRGVPDEKENDTCGNDPQDLESKRSKGLRF